MALVKSVSVSLLAISHDSTKSTPASAARLALRTPITKTPSVPLAQRPRRDVGPERRAVRK
jgi:hypothetical protein